MLTVFVTTSSKIKLKSKHGSFHSIQQNIKKKQQWNICINLTEGTSIYCYPSTELRYQNKTTNNYYFNLFVVNSLIIERWVYNGM